MTVIATNVVNGLEGIKKELKQKKAEGGGFETVLDDEGEEFIKLQISCHKLPKTKTPIPLCIKVPLPYSLVTAETNVYLITKDLEKGIRPQHDETARHFTDLLREHGALSSVSQVMPLRQLKVEYKEFEAKRRLSQIADVVLCDDRIIRFVPPFLGKFLYQKRKNPIPVNLCAKDLNKEINKALSCTFLHMKMKGNCGSINVGRLLHTTEEVSENVNAVINKLKEKYPGGWENVKSINMKTNASSSIPIYLYLTPPTKNIKHPKEKEITPYEGAANFDGGKNYKVYPGGEVQFVKAEVEEEDDATLPTEDKETAVDTDPKQKKRKINESEDEVVDDLISSNKKKRKANYTAEAMSSKSRKKATDHEQAYLRSLLQSEQELQKERKRKREEGDDVVEKDSDGEESEEEVIEGGNSDDEIEEEDSDEEENDESEGEEENDDDE